ncbi:hypothetical protein NIA69_12880 [Gemmiger formicilis]|nr:hypothetical protein [Gemmiger formicilis]
MQKQPLRVWLYARTADARPGVLEEQLNSLYREAERRGYTVVNGGQSTAAPATLTGPRCLPCWLPCAAGGWTPLCSPGFPGSATTGWRSI